MIARCVSTTAILDCAWASAAPNNTAAAATTTLRNRNELFMGHRLSVRFRAGQAQVGFCARKVAEFRRTPAILSASDMLVEASHAQRGRLPGVLGVAVSLMVLSFSVRARAD